MTKICVFAGTTEGRKLVEFLSSQPVAVTACVATEYGETLLTPSENLTVSAHRLTEKEMERMLREEAFDLVVDATHPYAAVVTENIAAACAAAGIQYLRLLREGNAVPEGAVYVPDISHAVAFLNGTEGNILLTTGSKELSLYTKIEDFPRRAYARVLPMDASLASCQAAGLAPAHIIAMQGPFSKELNVALLRAVHARYLVTKEGGDTGGFAEKAAAAEEAGATLVVVGRPPQRAGLSFPDTVALLCQRYGLVRRPQVTVVGIGPGSAGAMTKEVCETIENADCLIGAKRMLAAAARPGQAAYEAIAPEAIAECIGSHPEHQHFAVMMSGDVGFFSGAKKLLPLLKDCQVKILPGISSLAYLCARLGKSYEDVVTVSAHGRVLAVAPILRANRRVFALVGGENGAAELCRKLVEAGMGDVSVAIGERLSYPDEKITTGKAFELAEMSFSSLSAVLLENEEILHAPTPGLPDAAFIRGGGETCVVPMTKSEVRAVCLSKLRLPDDAVCWDIGAGTGSVAIEMALQASRGHVYAVECRDDALALLQENRRRFGAENLTVISGFAPAACDPLPPPTHAFIGGSSGNMEEILRLLLEKNPRVRIVATAVSLESVAELSNGLKEFNFTDAEVVSLTVARDRKSGNYHLMQGQNPIYIFTMQAGA